MFTICWEGHRCLYFTFNLVMCHHPQWKSVSVNIQSHVRCRCGLKQTDQSPSIVKNHPILSCLLFFFSVLCCVHKTICKTTNTTYSIHSEKATVGGGWGSSCSIVGRYGNNTWRNGENSTVLSDGRGHFTFIHKCLRSPEEDVSLVVHHGPDGRGTLQYQSFV